MPKQTTESPNQETHDIEIPVTVKGKTRFLSAAAFSNPAPTSLKNFLTGGRYFCVGAVALVSGSDLFSGQQAKIINFCLAAAILLLGAIQAATGVESNTDTNKRTAKSRGN